MLTLLPSALLLLGAGDVLGLLWGAWRCGSRWCCGWWVWGWLLLVLLWGGGLLELLGLLGALLGLLERLLGLPGGLLGPPSQRRRPQVSALWKRRQYSVLAPKCSKSESSPYRGVGETVAGQIA